MLALPSLYFLISFLLLYVSLLRNELDGDCFMTRREPPAGMNPRLDRQNPPDEGSLALERAG